MHTYTLKKFQAAFNLDLEVNLSVKLPTQYPDHLNHMRLDVDTTTSHEEGMRTSVRASDPSRRSLPYCTRCQTILSHRIPCFYDAFLKPVSIYKPNLLR
ncbi:hypothetical protein BDV35DRAFT_363136 [Aspergillus flavus]|uniref:Uncharacterized protein n=1 Tax=Aspergillus flavus TaxID=5059 RepID=A0A5N6GP68_ASPFL|nr:hypothetical protein BDV35DRAFT_363136 [Aspergillus flavus]